MILIVGLGNPEENYRETRHNFGFCFIDKIKEALEFPDFMIDKISNALISEKDDIILAKPQTLMNNSGKSVKKLLKRNLLIVIHDEAEIKLGEMKVNKNITSHGHKGVQSIIDEIKTKDFLRIRLGIDSEDESYKNKNLEDAVLKKFSKKEKEIIKNKMPELLKAILEIIENEKKS